MSCGSIFSLDSKCDKTFFIKRAIMSLAQNFQLFTPNISSYRAQPAGQN